MSGSTIKFGMGLETAQLKSDVEKAQAMVARAMGKMHASSAVAFAGSLAVAQEAFAKMGELASQCAEKVKGVFERGGQLEALSKQTGIATGRLFMMQKAFKDTDVDSEKLGMSINRLQKVLASATQGNSAATAVFSRLGIDFHSLIGMSPDRQFQAIAASIAGMSDPAERAGAAMGVFGRAGAELLPLFSNSSAVAAMGGALSTQAEAFEKNAELFHNAAVSIRQASDNMNGLFVGIAEGVAKSVIGVMDKAGKINFIAAGQAIGEAVGKMTELGVGLASDFDVIYRVANGIEAVFTGIVTAVLGLADASIMAAEFAVKLVMALPSAVGAGVAAIGAGLLELVGTIAQKLCAGLIWAFEKGKEFFTDGIFDVIASIAAGIAYAMNHAIAGIINHLPAWLKKRLGAGDVKEETFAQLKSDAQTNMAGMKSGYKAEAFGDIDKRIGASIGSAFQPVGSYLANSAKQGFADAGAAFKALPFAGLAKISDYLDPANWAKVTAGFWNAATGEPAKKAATVAAKQAGAPAPKDPYAAFRGFTTLNLMGPHGMPLGGITNNGGLGGGIGTGSGIGTGHAYGYVRHGDAARRKAAEQEAKKEAAKHAAIQTGDSSKLADGVDGTNDRLDCMIDIWGGKG